MFGFSRTRVNSLYMLLQCENLFLSVMILRGNEFYKPLADALTELGAFMRTEFYVFLY